MIEPEHPRLSVARQCQLLELPRSTYYHRPQPEADENLRLMRVIDETHFAYPFFGSRQMTRWLRGQGYRVNRKRVQRLMRQMGLEAIYRNRASRERSPAIGYIRDHRTCSRPRSAQRTRLPRTNLARASVGLSPPVTRCKNRGAVLPKLAPSLAGFRTPSPQNQRPCRTTFWQKTGAFSYHGQQKKCGCD